MAVFRLWIAFAAICIALFAAGAAHAGSATSNGITFSDVSLVQAQRGVVYETMPGSTTDLNTRVSGGTGPYTYTLVSGALPTGFSLSSTGQLTGVNCVDANGSFKFAVDITDSNSVTGHFNLSINMTAGPASACSLALTPQSLVDTIPLNQAYTNQISATGGTGPYTYSVASGSLPPGLAIDANGQITGTPTATGTYSFSVKATDSLGNGGYQTSTITVTSTPGAIVIGPNSLPNGTAGAPYSTPIVPTGGTGPYTCSISAGALPAGLSLTNNAIAGTPSAAGSYSFTVTCVDSLGATSSKVYNLTIDPGSVLNLGPASLPNPVQGISYTAAVVASGGSGTGYSYSITAGALPQGLTLNPATGAITGKTLASGTFTFTVRAVDSLGNWGTRTYTMTIQERPDPTRDREVIALSDGMFRVASRAAESQIGNAMRHNESLHGGLRCAVTNNLTVNAANPAATDAAAAAGTGRKASPVATSCDEPQGLFAVWATGSVDRDHADLERLQSDAITLGIDAQLGKHVIFGGAFGLGWGDNRFGTSGTHAEADAKSAMVYSSLGFGKALFLDVAAGKTWIDFNGKRYVTSDASLAQFSRKGDVGFGSAALTLEKPVGAILLAGQARYDYVRINLGGYGEYSASPYALTFGKADQTVRVLTLGVRAETTFVLSWGKIIPTGRVDYHHRNVGGYAQSMAYSDLLSRQYVLSRAATDFDSMSVSVGTRFVVGALELEAEYGSSGTAVDSFKGSELRFGLRARF